MGTNLNPSLRELAELEGFAEPVPRNVEGNGMSATGNWPLNVQSSAVRHSPTIGKLVEALCKAQLEFVPVVKANINPQFKSRYADLNTIIQATMPSLAKHGLAVIQTPNTKGKDLIMTTMLAHSSGEWIANDLTMPATMRDVFTAQTIGSACTYSRRYALQSILGVSADVDDDGTEASGGGTSEAAQAVGKKKIDALRASKAQETPSDGASLFYALQDSGLYAIAGDKELMKKLWPQFKKAWQQHAEAYMVNEEGLEQIRFQCEQGNIPLHVLKAPNA